MRKKKAVGLRPAHLLSYLALALGSAFMVGPLVWCFSSALKGPGQIFNMPPAFFQPPLHFENFLTVWNEMNFPLYSLNSLLIALLAVAGIILTSSFVGFGLARYRFRGGEVIFFVALATMMIPYQTLLIPQYAMWMRLGLLDTIVPLVAPYWFGTAFGIFMMRQSFKSISGELYEAAMVDGASPVGIFFKIYLPLVKTTAAALGVFTFITEWNDVFKPLIYLTTRAKYTLSLGVMYMRGEYIYKMELLMAATVMMLIPVLLVFLFAQKYFVQGIVSSGIKG